MPNITLTRAETQTLLDFCVKHNLKNWFLAKDQGAYVGAAAEVDGKIQNVIFYFRGCDPTKDADWYEEAHYKFGGDDFGEHFDVSILHKVLASETMKSFIISVGKTQIAFKTKHAAAPKVAATPKVAAPQKPSAPRKMNIGIFVREMIEAGMSNEDILDAVKVKYPNAKTSNASVNWYRSQLRKAA